MAENNYPGKRMKKNLLIVIFLVVILLLFCSWQNNSIVISHYEYAGDKVDSALNGLHIVHLSDLHNKEFHGRLAAAIKEQQPDFIVITGDLIDRNCTNLDIALDLVKEAVSLAPVYFVSGNHEEQSNMYPELQSRLKACGVIILDNEANIVEFRGGNFNFIGLVDPQSYKNKLSNPYGTEEQGKIIKEIIKANRVEDKFNILLAHRPEFFEVYAECGIDLVFTGHAHGGQIRLPMIGGLVAPGQGFLPKYTSGLHTMGNTAMVISRGLGNSIFPQRIFNRPELVVVTLKRI